MKPEDVLGFWLDEVGEAGWYEANDDVDAEITRRFKPTWESAREGALSLWMTYPSGTLAYLLLTDQFPRNMFRGSPEAFRCIRLMMTRMPEHGAKNLLHARAHRDVIRKFGRFPFRNEALERRSSEPEGVFLANGGYGATVRALQASS